MAKAKAEEEAESAAKARAGKEEEGPSAFTTVPLDDEQIASVRWRDTLEMMPCVGRFCTGSDRLFL